jgi:hypothetical protein
MTGPTRFSLNMPAIFALESHMDGWGPGMDPLQFRLKNYTNYCCVGTDAAILPTQP